MTSFRDDSPKSKNRYAELHALSNFTFLRGASHPEELVETATALGYEALAITDECTMSGVVRAHMAAKQHGLKKLVIGSELRLRSGRKLVILAQHRDGYRALCRLITNARRAAEKGSYELTRLAEVYEQDLDRHLKMMVALAEPALLFIMAVLVGTVVIGMLLPIFNLQELIR